MKKVSLLFKKVTLIFGISLIFVSGLKANENLLTGADMESSSGWHISFLGQPDSVEYDFGYTTDVPAAGSGGCLHLYNDTVEQTAQILLWQPVYLNAGTRYAFTGAYKEISAAVTTWHEVYIGMQQPSETEDYVKELEGNTVIAGFNAWDCPKYDGFDATYQDSACVGDGTYLCKKSGTYYLAIKVGHIADSKLNILIDDVALSETSLVNDGDMEDASGWNISYLGQPDSVEYEFSYTTDVPLAGSGSCLHLYNDTVEQTSQILLWQPVYLKAGTNYGFTGAYKEISAAVTTWHEVYVGTQQPSDTADYTKEMEGNMVIAGFNAWDCPKYDGFDATYQDSACSGDGTFYIKNEGIYYLAIKVGHIADSKLDILIDDVELTEIPIIKSGHMEDASGWNISYLGQPDSVEHEFNYTADIPIAGSGGSLHLYNDTVEQTAQILLWQPVYLNAATRYSFTGAYKEISASVTTWHEVYIGTQQPSEDEDYVKELEGNRVIVGFNAWDCPKYDGFDATYQDSACTGDGTFLVDTAGIYYLAIKVGHLAGSKLDILIDDVALTETSLLNDGNMDDATGWNISYLGQPDSVEYEFGYTIDLPSAGSGGCLHLYNDTVSQTAQILVWKPVELPSHSMFAFTGAYKEISASVTTWHEVYIGTQQPTETDDYVKELEGNRVIAGFNAWDCPKYDGFDATYQDSACVGDGTFYVDTAGIYYLAIKTGHIADSKLDILIDDLALTTIPDVQKPTATIESSPADTVTGEFKVTITFSEWVTGFFPSDLTIINGTSKAGTFVAVNEKTYTDTIIPTASGNVIIGLAADMCLDYNGNNNTAATNDTVFYKTDGVGVENIITDNGLISAYPNPVNDGILNYEIHEFNGSAQVRIVKMDGELVYQKILTNNKGIMDISSLKRGMYIINLYSGDKSSIQKLIIN